MQKVRNFRDGDQFAQALRAAVVREDSRHRRDTPRIQVRRLSEKRLMSAVDDHVARCELRRKVADAIGTREVYAETADYWPTPHAYNWSRASDFLLLVTGPGWTTVKVLRERFNEYKFPLQDSKVYYRTPARNVRVVHRGNIRDADF